MESMLSPLQVTGAWEQAERTQADMGSVGQQFLQASSLAQKQELENYNKLHMDHEV